MTTPNADYNALYPSRCRPARSGTRTTASSGPAHEFTSWADRVAERNGYAVEYRPVGDVDVRLGSPTQLALFRKVATDARALPSPTCRSSCSSASGSGKSTFAAHALRAVRDAVERLLPRACLQRRERPGGDQRGLRGTPRSSRRKRLDAGLLTVIDATNVQPEARALARRISRATTTCCRSPIVLDVPRARLRRAQRKPATDRTLRRVRRQAPAGPAAPLAARTSARGLPPGPRPLRGRGDRGSAQFVREPLLNDRRDERGPFDAIGDVHGCRSELETLLGEARLLIERDDEGRPDRRRSPRGPPRDLPRRPGRSRARHAGRAAARDGHGRRRARPRRARQPRGEARARASRARRCRPATGSPSRSPSSPRRPPSSGPRSCGSAASSSSHLVLDDGKLVVAHAGLIEKYQGRASGRVRSFALYGDTTGETDEYGLPVRLPWADDYRGKATVLYGHTPTLEAEWVNNTMCLDTGCVFGGKLSALRYPEREVVSVPAEQVWYEPVAPLGRRSGVRPAEHARSRAPAHRRRARQADRRDARVRQGRHSRGQRRRRSRGHEPLGDRPAPAALPAADDESADTSRARRTCSSTRPRRSPPTAERASTDVICEEKHMGSRAVVLLTRDPSRFDAPDRLARRRPHAHRPAVLRRGDDRQTFLDAARRRRERRTLGGARRRTGFSFDARAAAVVAQGGSMIREQYATRRSRRDRRAARGRCARSSRPPRPRSRRRRPSRAHAIAAREIAEAYRDAYRRYSPPVSGLDGVQLAPFQLLATEGASHLGQDHAWHLAIADRLAEADRSSSADPADRGRPRRRPDSEAAATTWWEELTAAGGEGMVVKPVAGLVARNAALAQPGIKVRGREYLRIIYGPDYTEPQNLARLRDRDVAHKRSMALREYALGVEAVERFVAGEPLWRVHQAVFGVLAMESEPVDPRL